jgi:hypothetical protein
MSITYGAIPLLGESEPHSRSRGESLQSIRQFRTQQRERHFDSWVLLPNSSFLRTWDIVIAVALCWTATISVFDVFVVESRRPQKEIWAFLLTACFDVIFITDTCLTFFRAFRYKHGGTRRLETNLRVIQRQYFLSFNFVVDFLSSIPFDVIIQVCLSVCRTVCVSDI